MEKYVRSVVVVTYCGIISIWIFGIVGIQKYIVYSTFVMICIVLFSIRVLLLIP